MPIGKSQESVTARLLDNSAPEVLSLSEIHKLHQRSRELINNSLDSSRKALADRIKNLKKRAQDNAKSIGRKKAISETITLLQKAESIYSEALQNAKIDCANLAISLAEQIIGESIKSYPNGLAKNIEAAISQLTDQRGLKIYVNPLQHKEVESELKKLALDYVEVSTNLALSNGDAIIESVSGSLELNWRERLEELKVRVLNTLVRKI